MSESRLSQPSLILVVAGLVAVCLSCSRGGSAPDMGGSSTTAPTPGTTLGDESDQGATQSVATVPPQGPPPVEGDVIETVSGLKYIEIEVGTGPTPQSGDVVVVDFDSWLEDGTELYSSGWEFTVGEGTDVIAGLNEGVSTMRTGGKRRLIIPPELHYGVGGSAGIPPNTALIFDVELLYIE